MRYEIHRKESCRPANMGMYEWLLKGRSRIGTITTDHSASSYGQPVILVEQWGGMLNYSDVKKIHIIKDENDSEEDILSEYERLTSKLSPFGITVSWS